jgi:hypothetical protein
MKYFLKIVVPFVVILGLFISAGCASKTSTAPIPSRSASSAPVAPPVPTGESINTAASDQAASALGSSSIDRKIVKTGYITLEVVDFNESMDLISKIASELGGYVVSSNKSESSDDPSGKISIRVPAEKFDEALGKLRKLAVKVPSESADSRDVTEEYTDLKARLHNLEATEAQYLVLLNKAATVDDILKVQRELSNVRGQIEQIKGRIQYLERTSDMSLIQISLYKTSSIAKKGWDVLGILKSAVSGLVIFGQFLVGCIIWVIIFCPIWIGIWVLVWWLIKKQNRKKV